MDETAYTWDDAKSDRCFRERGFDFGYAALIWEGEVSYLVDDRHAYGELRIRALGWIDGKPYVVVFTPRGNARHIMSARRAHAKEVRKWQS